MIEIYSIFFWCGYRNFKIRCSIQIDGWLCKYLYKHDCANNCTIIQLWIINAFSIHLRLCDLNNHDCTICTILIVQFAQSWMCNMHDQNCAICFFMIIIGFHLQNFTSIYNYLFLVYHDYIDDCTIIIFHIDANLCVHKKMSKLLDVDDCKIFYLLNIYIYSMHTWLCNHLKILIAQSFMQ